MKCPGDDLVCSEEDMACSDDALIMAWPSPVTWHALMLLGDDVALSDAAVMLTRPALMLLCR